MSQDVKLTYDGGWKLLFDVNSKMAFVVFLQVIQTLVLLALLVISASGAPSP